MRRIFAALVLLLIPGFLLADVKIDKKNRVPNVSPGYCTWCSLETLGRHHGVKKLYGLVEGRRKDSDIQVLENGYWVTYKANAGYEWTVKEKLNKLGVKYKYGNYDNKLIKYAMDNDLGFVGSVKSGALGKSAHSVVVVKYDSKSVEYIDPNDMSIYKATRKWWDQWSDGSIVVIEPEVRVVAAAKADEEEPSSGAPKIDENPTPAKVELPRPKAKASVILPENRVQPVIVGLDLKPIDLERLRSGVQPGRPPVVQSPIIQWRLVAQQKDDKK